MREIILVEISRVQVTTYKHTCVRVCVYYIVLESTPELKILHFKNCDDQVHWWTAMSLLLTMSGIFLCLYILFLVLIFRTTDHRSRRRRVDVCECKVSTSFFCSVLFSASVDNLSQLESTWVNLSHAKFMLLGRKLRSFLVGKRWRMTRVQEITRDLDLCNYVSGAMLVHMTCLKWLIQRFDKNIY